VPNWTQQDLHVHMTVYSADDQKLGQVANIYEDSFQVREGHIIHKNRYYPYSAIATVDKETIHLTMNEDEAKQLEWEKRPDYEDHQGDPLQLMYDRGHGIHDPFDETNPTQPQQ
jgi:hypothetical protein